MKFTRRQLKKLICEYFNLPADNVEYTAIILDEYSRNILMKFVPDNWLPVAHHITLIAPTVQKQGRLPKPYLGKYVNVSIAGIVKDEKVIAGIVDPGETVLPYRGPNYLHVTIATNPKTAGRPEMSNDLVLSDLVHVDPIIIGGTIKEIQK